MDKNSKYRKIVIAAGVIIAAVVFVLFAAGKLDWLFVEDEPVGSDYLTNSSSINFESYVDSTENSSFDGIDTNLSTGNEVISSGSEISSSSKNPSDSSSNSETGNSSEKFSESSSDSENSSSSENSSKSSSESSSIPTEKTLRFRSKNLLNQHYEKHGKDMGFSSAEEYETAAARVPYTPGVLHKIEAEDGDDVYYIESTNEFVVVSTDGYIRTYFNPDRGIDYFNRQ